MALLRSRGGGGLGLRGGDGRGTVAHGGTPSVLPGAGGGCTPAGPQCASDHNSAPNRGLRRSAWPVFPAESSLRSPRGPVNMGSEDCFSSGLRRAYAITRVIAIT